ncbi:AbgT family transporter [Streptomyces sp. NBC_01186]|uniref:AbgT family transporter n=1 Tax=unclassified Streptomyces TaxID=2593676 RepID=UPI002DD8D751|nr:MULTISPECIES: AbgT family transporter [unclassified Streptomyces]WSB79716.1 AbgT family transporter [Streptomyces sp. NBC_01775]WSS12078.1 AbgT family transporter [Streptomyces sp. NBC_01186]
MAKTTRTTPAATAPGGALLDRMLGLIERGGNRLPHPFYLFTALFALLAVTTTVLAAAGVTVRVPGADKTLQVHGLLTGEGIRWLLANLIPNFTGFPSLGTVLLMMMAVGVAERTGLLEAAVRISIARAPARLLPYAVAFIACQAHLMSDIAIIVIPPLAALAFKAAGRNPVAGLIGAFACVCAGYAAGFTIGALDALYVGITEKAAAVLPDVGGVETHILVNYFYTSTASVLLALLGGFLTSRVLEPRLPEPTGDGVTDPDTDEAAAPGTGADQGTGADPGKDGEAPKSGAAVPGAAQAAGVSTAVSAREKRGLLFALLSVALYGAAVVTAWLIPGSPLRGEGGALVPSPVLDGVVPILFVAFLLGGAVYGVTVRTLRSADDVPKIMAQSVTGMSGYIVLIFVISQVIGLFEWSNAGTLLAVKGASLLKAAGLTGFTGLLLFVLLVCVLNLFITSGSALWSLMAPVFVPTFMLLGLEPAVTQAAFRIGDSATQMITPMNPYLFLALALLRRYEPQAQLGTLLSRLAVFTVPFLAAWLAVLGIFYLADLPLGPGAGIHLP